MQRYTVIYPPTISWQEPIFQRPHQLLKEFAEQGHFAILCNLVADGRVKHWIARPNLLISNHLEATLRDPYVSKQMQNTKIVFWVSYTKMMPLRSTIRPDITVFDYIDEASEEFSHWQDGLADCLQIADHIFVVSDRLEELVKEVHSNKMSVLRNGADIRQYLDYKGPINDEILKLKTRFKAIIGFLGSLQTWVDYSLMAEVAKMRPDLGIVLIGPEYYPATLLKGLPNVFFLGHHSYNTLPSFVCGLDVGIVPFQVRDLTHSSNPIKMYEYLAAGIPVVATPLRECMNLSPYVRVAKTPAEFSQKIDEALLARTREKSAYQEIAVENSWTKRVKDAVAVFEGVGK